MLQVKLKLFGNTLFENFSKLCIIQSSLTLNPKPIELTEQLNQCCMLGSLCVQMMVFLPSELMKYVMESKQRQKFLHTHTNEDLL